jgi:hypothetical protein
LQLYRARCCFSGAIDTFKNHLVNPGRPRFSHTADGYSDWRRYGFESLAVEAVRERDGVIELVLSATDPEAALAGIEKYCPTWQASIHAAFGRELRIRWARVRG